MSTATQELLANREYKYGFTTDITLDNQNGWTNVENYYNAVVTPQVAVGRDLDGQSAPGQRKYRGAVNTSYTFDEGRLKGFSIGGCNPAMARLNPVLARLPASRLMFQTSDSGATFITSVLSRA